MSTPLPPSPPRSQSSTHSSSPSSRDGQEWERHWPILLLTVGMGAALVLLEIRSGGGVGLRGGGFPELPAVCLSRRLFGVDCPGCGLTRSLVSLARGDLAASWSYHRLGWAVALAILIQFFFRIFVLVRLKGGRAVSCRWLDYLGLAVVTLLFANWCWPGDEIPWPHRQ